MIFFSTVLLIWRKSLRISVKQFSLKNALLSHWGIVLKNKENFVYVAVLCVFVTQCVCTCMSVQYVYMDMCLHVCMYVWYVYICECMLDTRVKNFGRSSVPWPGLRGGGGGGGGEGGEDPACTTRANTVLNTRSKHGSKHTGLAGRTMHTWNRRSDLQKGLACAGFFLPDGRGTVVLRTAASGSTMHAALKAHKEHSSWRWGKSSLLAFGFCYWRTSVGAWGRRSVWTVVLLPGCSR